MSRRWTTNPLLARFRASSLVDRAVQRVIDRLNRLLLPFASLIPFGTLEIVEPESPAPVIAEPGSQPETQTKRTSVNKRSVTFPATPSPVQRLTTSHRSAGEQVSMAWPGIVAHEPVSLTSWQTRMTTPRFDTLTPLSLLAHPCQYQPLEVRQATAPAASLFPSSIEATITERLAIELVPSHGMASPSLPRTHADRFTSPSGGSFSSVTSHQPHQAVAAQRQLQHDDGMPDQAWVAASLSSTLSDHLISQWHYTRIHADVMPTIAPWYPPSFVGHVSSLIMDYLPGLSPRRVLSSVAGPPDASLTVPERAGLLRVFRAFQRQSLARRQYGRLDATVAALLARQFLRASKDIDDTTLPLPPSLNHQELVTPSRPSSQAQRFAPILFHSEDQPAEVTLNVTSSEWLGHVVTSKAASTHDSYSADSFPGDVPFLSSGGYHSRIEPRISMHEYPELGRPASVAPITTDAWLTASEPMMPVPLTSGQDQQAALQSSITTPSPHRWDKSRSKNHRRSRAYHRPS